MRAQQHGTAILAFVGDPLREARRKALLADPAGRRNTHLWRQLNNRLRGILSRTGLPVIWLEENQQQGATFGERLINGMAMAFARGYSGLLVVGNDCPRLSPRHLRQAAEALARQPLVLGPDHRGGAYLIGLRKDAFQPGDWLGLPWQTDQLLKALLRLGEASGTVLLTGESDLNQVSDLLRLLPRLSPGHILRRLVPVRSPAPEPLRGRPGQWLPGSSGSGLAWRGPPAGA
jgi:hypothetical protein